jgi:hypothetical protein
LGISFAKGLSIADGGLVFLVPILFIAFFWRRMEAAAHKHYLDVWQKLRLRGKWYFIIT